MRYVNASATRPKSLGAGRAALVTGVSALALAHMLAGTAAAQTSPNNQLTSTSAAPGSDSLAEVVVTAQKRNEKLEDVPISISVVSPALLEDTNAKNFVELSGAVPGVMFNGNGGGGRNYLSLRGTTGSALNTGDEPVAIYLDDVYVARGLTVSSQDLLDVGSVEVVRGPQGTLQGRNATAGAILIHSADPTSTPTGYMKIEEADPQEFRAQAALSGPLGNGLAGRLALGYVNAQGYGKNLYDGSHVGGDESGEARAVVTYSGDSPLTARFVADYSSTSNTPALFRYAQTTFSTSPTGNLIPVATPTVPLTAAQKSAIFDNNDFYLYPNTSTTVTTGGVSLKLDYALPGMDLVSVTGYRRTHVFGTNNSSGLATPPRIGDNNNNDASSEFSEEARLQSSGTGPFSWILGLYYMNEDQVYNDVIYNLQFSTPTSTATLYSGSQNTEAYAAFADATYNILDNLKVIGGVRFSDDNKRLVGSIQTTNTVTQGVTYAPYLPQPAAWTDTTYRTKLVYQPIEHLMAFIGYSTGFRAGGYNDFAVQAPFAPEKIRSVEGGIKGDLFSRHLEFSATGYHNDYDNLQLRAGVPSGGAIITNAATAEINGFEAEVTMRPLEHTRITANTAHADAKFTSFPRAVDLFNNFVDASGNHLPNAPAWQAYASIAQDFPLANDWNINAEMNYRWRDKIYFYYTNQTDAPWQDGAHGVLNGRLSVMNDDWTVAAFVTNITNERMISTDVVTFSYPEVSLNNPRSFGFSVERRF